MGKPSIRTHPHWHTHTLLNSTHSLGPRCVNAPITQSVLKLSKVNIYQSEKYFHRIPWFREAIIYFPTNVCFTVYQVIFAIKRHIKSSALRWGNERVNLLWRVPSHLCSLLPSLSYYPVWQCSVPAHMLKKRILFDWMANLKCQLFLCKLRYSFSCLKWVEGTDGCAYVCARTNLPP